MDQGQSRTLRQPLNPLAGRLLDDRYQLLDVVGQGGMATVFRARDLRLERIDAVKVLHPRFGADPGFVARFHREASFAAGLSGHPNIVAIHDVGQDGELHYIVMELVEGQTLKELIAREAPLSAERAFDIGRQIASALHHAHEHGLVHRDVKPQNVLLTADGRAKVTDFGIAHADGITQLTRAGMILGTAHYLSPEGALGRRPDARSDVYSLGIVLYEMLTARRPFEADTLTAVAMQHVHDEPPSPLTFNNSIPAVAAQVVMRALAKRPENRYPDAAALDAALERALLPRPANTTAYRPLAGTTAAPAAGGAVPGTPVARRGWWGGLATPLIAALALAAALGGWLTLHSGGHTAKRPGAASVSSSAPPHIVSNHAAALPSATPAATALGAAASHPSPTALPPTATLAPTATAVPPTPTSAPAVAPPATPTAGPQQPAPENAAPPHPAPPEGPPGQQHSEKRGFARGDTPRHDHGKHRGDGSDGG